jgi:hypothetical protein
MAPPYVVFMLFLAVVLLGAPYCFYFITHMVGVRDPLGSVLGGVLALGLSLFLHHRLKPWLRWNPPPPPPPT